jgi:catalase-peroxidase
MGYFDMLFGYEWELVKSPAGAGSGWRRMCKPEHMIPDAHDPSKKHAPMMTTADLSLRFDPIYEPISRRFHKNPKQFADAFARAWFKLTHRDMGPKVALPRPGSPAEDADLAGPGPGRRSSADRREGHRRLKAEDPGFGLSTSELVPPPGLRPPPSAVRTSAAAPTVRASAWRRKRTGKPTSRRNWRRCWACSKASSKEFNAAQSGGKKVSLADLIVLGGCAAVEAAAKAAGHAVTVPFTPGRTDASQAQTDVESFAVLEPEADGFRNYQKTTFASRPKNAGRQGAVADPERARDDRARRRPACAWRQCRAVTAWRVHQAGPAS